MAKVAALSCAVALAAGGGLSLQLAHGDDPTLGPKAASIADARKARPKRIIKTTILRKEQPPKLSGATSGASTAPPTTSGSAPATSAPAAPAAAAPAPAPVQTSTS